MRMLGYSVYGPHPTHSYYFLKEDLEAVDVRMGLAVTLMEAKNSEFLGSGLGLQIPTSWAHRLGFLVKSPNPFSKTTLSLRTLLFKGEPAAEGTLDSRYTTLPDSPTIGIKILG